MPYPCSELLWSQSQECGLSSIAWKWLTSPRFSKTTVLFLPFPTLSFPTVEIGSAGDPPPPGTVWMARLGFGTSRDQIPPSVLPTAAPFNRRRGASVAATQGWDETYIQIYRGGVGRREKVLLDISHTELLGTALTCGLSFALLLF